jgi:hypothetical protein
VSGRRAKTAGFLTLTGVVLAWELVASFDHDPDTLPWTSLIVQYIPGEVTAAAIGALVVWLPAHFGLRYYRRYKDRGSTGPPASS